MHVQTVTSADFSLLHGVRSTLASADDALLCVAFVHERGRHLILFDAEREGRFRFPSKQLDQGIAAADDFVVYVV